MSLFKKKPDIIAKPEPDSRIEIEVARNASNEAVNKAKEVNEHVKDLLVENGFTLKIYLAAGGRRKGGKP